MTRPVSEDNISYALENGAPRPAERIADPGPLGLGAFVMTTFVLSCVNAGDCWLRLRSRWCCQWRCFMVDWFNC